MPSPTSNVERHCYIDTAWLTKLHADLGSSAEFMVMLARDYRDAGESFIAAVEGGQGPTTLVELAHSLAGASGLLGLRRVLELAQFVELSPTSASISALIDVLPGAMDTLDSWANSLT